MRARTERDAPATPKAPIAVRIDLNGRGAWEVTTSSRREPITCETLDDAKRVAYISIALRRPCELIVCDAYHRVLRHEFINGQGGPADATDRG
jgi:hypothetical protein